MEGFGGSASGGQSSASFGQSASTSSYNSSQHFNSGGGGGGGNYSSSSSRMVGFGSDGKSFQPQQSGGGPGGSPSSILSQDVTTAVSSAVDSISGMIRSTLAGSNKEVGASPFSAPRIGEMIHGVADVFEY